ncbi:MAG: dipeptidase [Gemmatimonadales bacterium]
MKQNLMSRRAFVSSTGLAAVALATDVDPARATPQPDASVVVGAVGLAAGGQSSERARITLGLAKAAGIGVVVSPVFEGARRDAALLALARRRRMLLELSDISVAAEQAADIVAEPGQRIVVVAHGHGFQWADGNLGLIAELRAAGLRATKLSSGWRNRAADGVHESTDLGLTRFGRAAVGALNRRGLLIDLASTGRRSSLDVMGLTGVPVVFTHANAASVHAHPLNLSDQQIRACAGTGGVVGVSALADLVGGAAPSVADLVRHVAHIANLVGVAHVGIGWDLDAMSVRRYSSDHLPPHPLRYAQGLDRLDGLRLLNDGLARAGFTPADRAAVMGGNFARVFRRVWSV